MSVLKILVHYRNLFMYVFMLTSIITKINLRNWSLPLALYGPQFANYY
jgi:hypothetical protein